VTARQGEGKVVKLTNRNVAILVRPADKDDVVIWDDDLPGFGVRLRGDKKTYLIQYRIGAQQRRESLGDIRKTALEAARKAARHRFARVELGHDPAAEHAAARAKAAATQLTLGVVAERYLDAKKAGMRPATYQAAKRYFTVHWKSLANRPLAEIRRADVAVCLQNMAKERGRTAASRARANLSALFGWALREGLCDANPIIATNDPAAGALPRDRVLTEAELATIWRACQDDDFGRIVRLLILSGCRRLEIGELKWSEVDFDRGAMTIAGARTKNHRALTLTLPPVAIDLLRATPRCDGRENVFGTGADGFSSWSYAANALNDRIAAAEGKPLPHWTLHDLRRSVATHMADDEIGIQPHIIEALLNHVSGHKRGVAGIYNRARYDREIAAALQLWAEHLTAIIEGRKRKIVPLRA
jgi:integrase